MPAINVSINIQGIVQGVGFRPTVFIYAHNHHLTGWVMNSAHGVDIELHGNEADIQAFIDELRSAPPKQAKIDLFTVTKAPTFIYPDFSIRDSVDNPEDFLPVSPDLAICPDCRAELFSTSDRRFRYPFINCTNCGPRFSIVQAVPYDRPSTTMKDFNLCPDCAAEYHDPRDRRFHAQPVACPVCGPGVWLQADGEKRAEGEEAIQLARALIMQGKILALKGLGGFHLACDAHNEQAVALLRQRKQRSGKPFALMAANLETIRRYAVLSHAGEELLTGPQAPIALLDVAPGGKELAKITAPGQKRLGFMIPYTPLHLLITEPAGNFTDVLVMTSANLSEEPIAYRNEQALINLKDLADAFLMHNRPINMRVDDSVVSMVQDEPYLVRRARGYAPMPVSLPVTAEPLLAAGTHLKNTFCLARDRYAFVSHYIGDLENQETLTSYKEAVAHYEKLFRIHPRALACDMHPDYLATHYASQRAEQEGLPLIKVQHHHAHIAACLAENQWNSKEKVIGLAFDGTGYGTDGTIWGGEVLIAGYADFKRRFHLAPVPLPGGDLAVRKPARMALSYLLAAGLDPEDQALAPVKYLSKLEADAVKNQVQMDFNAPKTSSLGRLFDAVASLAGLVQEITYEAEGAIVLEAMADPDETGDYPLPIAGNIVNPIPLIKAVVQDVHNQVSTGVISARFHNGILRAALEASLQIRSETGINQVALSGGVWQNLFLANKMIPWLRQKRFMVFYHHQLPPNDGCVSLGQAMVALSQGLSAKE